jgi:hypothetical protein
MSLAVPSRGSDALRFDRRQPQDHFPYQICVLLRLGFDVDVHDPKLSLHAQLWCRHLVFFEKEPKRRNGILCLRNRVARYRNDIQRSHRLIVA